MIPILLVGAAYLIGKTMKQESFAKGGGVPLLAPNGKPSKLTPEQYKLVRTPEFKAWFGDWENNPENASKVVDENGEPLVVYRGNRKNQDELGYQFNLGNNFLEKPSANNFGFFFTDRIDIAKKYMDVDVWDEVKGGSLTSVFLKSEKMLDLTDFGLQIGQESFIEGLKHKGISFIGYENLIDRVLYYFDDNTYEGWGAWVFDYFDIFPELRYLFLKNGITSILFLEKSRNYFNYNVYVVFDSKEIKLADGTNTTFDGSNPDIRYNRGGSVSSKLNYNGIFSTKTTGISGLDNLLQDDGYNYFYKGVSGEIVMMPPEEYLKKVRTDITSTGKDEGIYEEKKERINEAINKGYKINMPYLSLKENGKAHQQEGRNRATIAKERGEKLIPVFIEKDISFNDKISKGKKYIESAIKDGANNKQEVLNKLKEQELHRDAIRFIDDNFNNADITYKKGGRTIAQTPAPKSDRIYGSKVNAKGSASSEKSASKIVLSEKIIDTLKKKLFENKNDNVTLNDLKAVYRRGLGAYSSSHRPTITGGKPNSRNAWAMARVNKFLLKANGVKVKKAYVQDDDLLTN